MEFQKRGLAELPPTLSTAMNKHLEGTQGKWLADWLDSLGYTGNVGIFPLRTTHHLRYAINWKMLRFAIVVKDFHNRIQSTSGYELLFSNLNFIFISISQKWNSLLNARPTLSTFQNFNWKGENQMNKVLKTAFKPSFAFMVDPGPKSGASLSRQRRLVWSS